MAANKISLGNNNIFSKRAATELRVRDGKVNVKFADEFLKIVAETGEFPIFKDSTGRYIFFQLEFIDSGKKTASYEVAKICQYIDWRNLKSATAREQAAAKQASNIVKVRIDYKREGDEFFLNCFEDSVRQMFPSKFRFWDIKQIMEYLLNADSFPVYIYNYTGKKRDYLQVAWSKEDYSYKKEKSDASKRTGKTEAQLEEEALPLDLDED